MVASIVFTHKITKFKTVLDLGYRPTKSVKTSFQYALKDTISAQKAYWQAIIPTRINALFDAHRDILL